MNKLQLELSTKGKKINMNLSTENEATIELAVLQSFAFMGVADPFAATKPVIDSALEIEEDTEGLEEVVWEKADELTVASTEEKEAKDIAMTILEKTKDEPVSRPRAIQLTNGSEETVLAYSTKEDEPEKKNIPSPYNGTKLYNGITKYQTRYECPSCGNRGKRYLALDEHIAICHECNKGIKKEPVGEHGALEQDSFGNYFIAKHGIL